MPGNILDTEVVASPLASHKASILRLVERPGREDHKEVNNYLTDQ